MADVKVVRVFNRKVPSGITETEFTQEGGILVGTGAGTFIEKPPGSDGKYLKYDSTAAGGVTADTPSIDVQDTTNYLLNGGFNFAQRQTPGTLTTVADGGKGADRWKMTRENADLQYVRQDASGESGLTSVYYGQVKKITNAGKFLLCQVVEYKDTLKFRGRVLGFQLQMKASAAKTIKIAIVELQAGGTADTLPTLVSAWNADTIDPTLGANLVAIGTPVSCAVTTAWQTFQFTGTFPATSKNLLVMLWSDSDFAVNDTLSLAETGLYRGTTQQSWNPRSFTEELRLCQYYYQKTFAIDTAPVQNIGNGDNTVHVGAGKAGANSQYVEWRLPVPMRAGPSATLYNPFAANAQVRDFDAGGDCSAPSVNSYFNVITIFTTGNVATAVGNLLIVHIAADAEF